MNKLTLSSPCCGQLITLSNNGKILTGACPKCSEKITAFSSSCCQKIVIPNRKTEEMLAGTCPECLKITSITIPPGRKP